MISWLFVDLGMLGLWLMGFFAACQILKSKKQSESNTPSHGEVIERIGLGLVLGLGLTSTFYFLWSLAGLPFSRTLAFSWTIAGIILGGREALRIEKQFREKPDESNDKEANTKSKTKNVFLGILIFLFVTTMIQTLLTPQRFWDERAAFGIKAIVLFQEGTIHSDLLSHPDFVQYHPKYPLLIPLNETHIYYLMGEVEDRWSKVIFPLMYIGLTLTVLGVFLQEFKNQIHAYLFAILLATIPAMVFWEYGFLCGQADSPVACFHTISVLYLWKFLRRAERSSSMNLRPLLTIAGLSAAWTIFTKDEGIAFLMVDLVALLFLMAVFFRKQFFKILIDSIAFFVAVGVVIIPWFLHRSGLPATTEMSYFDRIQSSTLTEEMADLMWALRHLIDRMFFQVTEWGLQWWGVVISIIAYPFRALKPSQLFILLDIFGALAALIIAGMIAPTPVEEHIGGSSHRFLIQISGCAVLFLAGQWVNDE